MTTPADPTKPSALHPSASPTNPAPHPSAVAPKPMNLGSTAQSKLSTKEVANDGRYFPNKYAVHPGTDNLLTGDAVYVAHNGNQFFVISAEQAAKGMVLGDRRFPEPANLLEIVDKETSSA
jgi:hypothetical protein